MPPKAEGSTAADRLAAVNNQLKVDGLEQEDRLRRMQATVQKLEAEIAALLRKAKAMGMPLLIVSSPDDDDEEVERLEATARDIKFRNEALEKQLLILKHSPSSALGKPQKSVFARKQAWAPTPQSKPKPVVKKESKASFALSEDEEKKFVAELTRQLKNQQEILKKAEQEAEEALIKAGANQENRWHLKTTDELRKIVKELETKTTILQTSEDHILKTMVNEQEGHRKLKVDLADQTKDLEKLREDIDQLKSLRRVMELRKDGNAEIREEIQKRTEELTQLEKENEALRLTAFSAGHAKITAKRNDSDRTALLEENGKLKAEVDELRVQNTQMDQQSAGLESEGEQSIAQLKKRLAQSGADAKLLERNTTILRDKLDAFVGVQRADERDSAAIQQAKLLAKRMGIPLYLQSAEGKDAEEVEQLRREVRRLRVGNASEVREISKLKQMLHLQQHLASDWSTVSTQDTKQLVKMKRAHSNKLLQLERKIAGVVAKNERLKQQLAASKIESQATLSALAEGSGRDSSLRIEDMAAGKALVAVTLEKLVLSRSYGDFGRVEPETMVVLDFFLHDTQHSPPIIGLAAASVLHRELEVTLDPLFLRFLQEHCLSLQLLRVRGLEFEVIAKAELPLRQLLQPEAAGAMAARVQLLSLPAGKAHGGTLVGELQASLHIQASAFAGLARAWQTKHREGPAGEAPAVQPGASGAVSRGVKEAFERRLGETYVLTVTVQSVSSLVIPSLGKGPAPRPRLYVMYQLLDFPLEESESVNVLETADVSTFSNAASFYRLPSTPAWDRKLLAGKLEVGVFDETDVGSEGLVGTASLMLAPLLSHRGIATTVALRDARDSNSGYVTLDVSWEAEPAPKLILPGTGLHGGKEAVKEQLAALRRWVEALGLGEVEAACHSLFEEWRKEPPEGGYYDGITEGQWRGVLRREAAKLKLLSDAEIDRVFHHLADEAAGGGGPRLLRREVLVDAILWSRGGGAGKEGGGAGAAEGKEERKSGAGEMEEEGEELTLSVELIRRSEPHSPEQAAASQEREGGEGGVRESLEGGSMTARAGEVAVVRVAVRAVRCLPPLLEREECGELAVRVACLVEGLDSAEQRFDNRQVPGGFVELEKEWGRTSQQRQRLRDKAGDAASAVEVQLWQVPAQREEEVPLQPATDVLLGVWRLSFAELRARGDLVRRTITIAAVAAPEPGAEPPQLLEAVVDVEARALLSRV